jgi:hypothetical protein
MLRSVVFGMDGYRDLRAAIFTEANLGQADLTKELTALPTNRQGPQNFSSPFRSLDTPKRATRRQISPFDNPHASTAFALGEV